MKASKFTHTQKAFVVKQQAKRGGAGGIDGQAGQLVNEAVVIALSAEEILVFLRVAATQGNPEQVVDAPVDLAEESVILGRQIVWPDHLQEPLTEHHAVEQVGVFLEVIGAQYEVQIVVERGADQLQFLAELRLLQRKRAFEVLHRTAVQIDPDGPVEIAVSCDRLEREIVGQVEIHGAGKAPAFHAVEAVAGGIAEVWIAGDETVVVGQPVVVRIPIDIGPAKAADLPFGIYVDAAWTAYLVERDRCQHGGRRFDAKVVQISSGPKVMP